jgi:predicted Rossmann-fold nucleotide-binding protein
LEGEMLRKLPIVGVFGSGSLIDAARTALAQRVGVMVARLGAHLLTGGGYGIMAAVSQGFVDVPDRAGLSIGIIPRRPDGAFDEPGHDTTGRNYPNPCVEIAIRTPLPSRAEDWRTTPARNHVNVLTADAIIALPGGFGTANELEMAIEYYGERHRPPSARRTMLLGPAEEFTPMQREQFLHSTDIAEAERFVQRVLEQRKAA